MLPTNRCTGFANTFILGLLLLLLLLGGEGSWQRVGSLRICPAGPAPMKALFAAAANDRAAETAAVDARLQHFDGALELQKFLLSQALRACSLMVALAPAGGDTAPESPGIPNCSFPVGSILFI